MTHPRASSFLGAGTYPLIFLSGLIGLVFEVTLERKVAFVLGGSLYSSTITLTAFILGYSIGTVLFKRFRRLSRSGTHTFAFANLALFAFAPIATHSTRPLSYLYILGLDLTAGASSEFLPFLLSTTLVSILIGAFLAVPGTLAALAYLAPVHSEAILEGRTMARTYIPFNLGALCGAWLTGFVLIPLLGVNPTIQLAGGLGLLVGMVSIARFLPALLRRPRTWVALVVGGIAFVSLAFLPEARPRYAPNFAKSWQIFGRSLFAESRHLFERESSYGRIEVTTQSLMIDGHIQCGARFRTMVNKWLLADIPLRVNPGARVAFIQGFGCGTTAAAVLERPEPPRLVVAELDPVVLDAARQLTFYNGELEDPRLSLVVNDARHHLHYSTERYGAIIGDPPALGLTGTNALYSREYFQLIHDRLGEDGSFSTWINNKSERLTLLVYRTLLDVFPHVYVVVLELGHEVNFLATRRPLTSEALARIAASPVPEKIPYEPGAPTRPLSELVADGDLLIADCSRLPGLRDLPVVSDDNLLVEVEAARIFFTRSRAGQGDVERLIEAQCSEVLGG